MANRLRQAIESIVFAGLKPSGGKPQPGAKEQGWIGRAFAPIRRFIDGGNAPLDPFYLSNRTIGQRVRTAIIVAVPIVILGAVVAIALTNQVGVVTKQQAEPTAAELAKQILPNLPKDIKIESHTDVQVTEASVKGGIVTGSVRNNTDRPYHAAELVFDLTDSVGSQVGAITTTVRDLGAKATVRFSVPIKQRDAAFVLVREVHTE